MAATDVSEKGFEETIERVLLRGGPDDPAVGAGGVKEPGAFYGDYALGGYRKRRSEDYDRELCLDPGLAVDFVQATQPKQWQRLKQQYGEAARAQFLKRLASEVARRGTLDVLRKGIKDAGSKFALAYFRPSSGLNVELQRLYEGNLFSVVRQLRYSVKTGHSLDMALFLNGLPIFTAELKNPLMGQNVRDAIGQYRADRDPKEPLFHFGRCLAHFAVDPDEVFVATQLEGANTRFLPFNQGRYGGAGNPPSAIGFATAYLWERIWSRDSVLNLIQQFIQIVEEEDDEGKNTGRRRLIFPRYHQLDAVRRLVADARSQGTGRRYLVQHSAGSGKSNSIAWLAHQLSVLHDVQDKRVFDSIIVITDRRVLDRQLQGTVKQFEQTLGVVENIDKTSKQLKQALEEGKTIIVTTLQKFPMIEGQIAALPGRRFAVIVDEAHSSQSGDSTKSLKAVLKAGSLEAAEAEERDEGDDLEDRIVATMRARGHQRNVSTFAFTATPKPKTLELFGTRRPDGKFEAFSLYSMRQAIEEGFILDVLQNYTTYHTYWSLLKKVEDDPRYDRKKATALLKQFVDLHPHAIATKAAIMLDHFANTTVHRIGGKAKAMIVTRSRLHAIRYKQAVDRYIKEKGYGFKALVAFSGTVEDGGLDYTEAWMNGFRESQTAETFKRDEYRVLIVANKFQTGFDQPLLHTMYVDKKLGGVNAVQTLSRLNRTYPGKQDTMVLDFANDAEEIRQAFAPYYEKTILSEATDPNLLYDLETRLSHFGFYSQDEVDAFAAIYFTGGGQDKLHALLDPVVERCRDAPPDVRADFRGQLNDYIRLYGFLSQVVSFGDADLERLYAFSRLLLRKLLLTVDREHLPIEVLESVNMDSYRAQPASKGKISLPRGQGELPPIGSKPGPLTAADEMEVLSKIIQQLNERFGTDFSDEDKVFIKQLEATLDGDAALEASVRVNTPENARLTFEHKVTDRLQDLINTHSSSTSR